MNRVEAAKQHLLNRSCNNCQYQMCVTNRGMTQSVGCSYRTKAMWKKFPKVMTCEHWRENILSETISITKILASSITADRIEVGTITASKIALNAVTK